MSALISDRATPFATPYRSLPMSALFPKNVGTIDRVARFALGIGLLSMAFTGPKAMWGYLGFIPLLTATLNSCPLYTLLGFSTCKVRQSS